MAEKSAELVECRDELLTNILSRVSTRDVLKMSTVRKRWCTLIFYPGFVHTHLTNRHKESIIFLTHTVELPTPEQYQFQCYNYQTGNLSIVPFSLEGLETSFRNGMFDIVATSNGLICFYAVDDNVDVPVLWVYNPVIKFLKKLTLPSNIYLEDLYFAEICYTHNTLKFVMAGLSHPEEHPFTLVFDFHLNSWYSGQPQPLLNVIHICQYFPLGTQVFFNGVIYFVVRVTRRDAQELEGFGEGLFEDGDYLLHMIIGYDVNHDRWDFSLFVPASVGYICRLTEWEGNLLVCASMSYGWYNNDGHFALWILDTEHKLWIRKRELNLSHELQTSWDASARGDIVCFAGSPNTVIVYHMKSRHWSRHRLDNAVRWVQPRDMLFATFEPTLLSF